MSIYFRTTFEKEKKMSEGKKKNLDTEQQQKVLMLKDELAEKFDEKEAEEFLYKNEGKSWFDDFKLLYDMMVDPDYTLDTKTKIAIAGTLAYVIFPIDVIPDLLPIIGWIDDVFILGFTINSIAEEIERYKAFKGLE